MVAFVCVILLLWLPVRGDMPVMEDGGGGRLLWLLLAASFVGMTVLGKVSSRWLFVVVSVLYILLLWRVMEIECGGVCMVRSAGGIAVVVGAVASVAGTLFAFLSRR